MYPENDIKECIKDMTKFLKEAADVARQCEDPVMASVELVSRMRKMIEHIYSRGLNHGFKEGYKEARKTFERDQAKKN